jgi:MFS transporter, DHA3 family, macrolide efflux protein
LSNQPQIEAPAPAHPPVGFSADKLEESPVQDTAAAPTEHPAQPPESTPQEESNTVTYRELLQNSNFRMLWLGQGITTFGSFFTRVAIPIYVFNITGSYQQLGFSFFVTLLPSLLFGLFAGALVDRWDRRRTMIGTDLLNFLLLCGLIAVIVLPVPTGIKLGTIYVITFFASILREMFNPARVAIFTEVVNEKELLPANSLDQSSQTLGELLSYPVAAYALTLLGPALAFGVDAASFLISALLIWRVKVRPRPVETSEGSNIWNEMKSGLVTVSTLPLLRKIVVLSLIVPMTFTLLATLTLPFAVEELGSTSAIGFSALEGSLALGITIGLLLLGRWGQHVPRWKLLAIGITSFGAVVAAVGLVPQIGGYFNLVKPDPPIPWSPLLLLAMPLVFVQGMTNSLIFTCIRTVMQEESPRAMIGRVASVVSATAGVGSSIGALLTGIGEGRADVVISIIGVILCGIGLFSLWWLRMPPRNQAIVQPLAG